MLTYDEALNQILSQTFPLNASPLPLLETRGLVLAEPLVALVDLPPFANSQMDGFALVASDTSGASSESPVTLKVTGEIAAGCAPSVMVEAGNAVRIYTGAPIPVGADAVVAVEDTVALPNGAVGITEAANVGQFIRPAGQDARTGDNLTVQGAVVTPAVIALAAASGHGTLQVVRRPRVAVLATGDELVGHDHALATGQIYDSNSFTLAAMVEEAGSEVVYRGVAGDSPTALRNAFDDAAASGADVILTAGGVSVGDYDFVKAVFAERGTVDFWRVAIRPGKPFAFGRWGSRLFFGLPGNPVSAMVTFELFVRPSLRALAGHASPTRPVLNATLTEPIEHDPGRRSFVRGRVWREGDRLLAASTGGQGSHMLRAMAAANALLVVSENVAGYGIGDMVPAMLIGEMV